MSNDQYEKIVHDIGLIKNALLGNLETKEPGILSEIQSICRWRSRVNKSLLAIVGFMGSCFLVFLASIL